MTVSSLRTLTLADYLPREIYGRYLAPVAMRWPTKASADNLDYAVDLTDWLTDTGDTIAQLTVTATACDGTSGPITVTNPTFAGSLVTLWLSGGVAGATYRVVFVVTTTGGRTVEFAASIAVDPTLP
jgi:hypothetical protein